MFEVELWKHEQSLRLRIGLQLVSLLISNLLIDLQVPAFQLALIRLKVLKECINWQLVWYFGLRQQMNNIKLERRRALLAHRQDLEPCQPLDVVDDLCDINPLDTTERLVDCNLQALELTDFCLLLLLVL